MLGAYSSLAIMRTRSHGRRGSRAGRLLVYIGAPDRIQALADAVSAHSPIDAEPDDRGTFRSIARYVDSWRTRFGMKRAPAIQGGTLSYRERVVARLSFDPSSAAPAAVLPYFGEPIEGTGFEVRLEGTVMSDGDVCVLIVAEPPSFSALECSIQRRLPHADLARSPVTASARRRLIVLGQCATEAWVVQSAQHGDA